MRSASNAARARYDDDSVRSRPSRIEIANGIAITMSATITVTTESSAMPRSGRAARGSGRAFMETSDRERDTRLLLTGRRVAGGIAERAQGGTFEPDDGGRVGRREGELGLATSAQA